MAKKHRRLTIISPAETASIAEYLETVSQAGLQEFEIRQLGRAADIRAELRRLLEDWVQREALALFARFLIDRRAGVVKAVKAERAAAETTAKVADVMRLLADRRLASGE